MSSGLGLVSTAIISSIVSIEPPIFYGLISNEILFSTKTVPVDVTILRIPDSRT